MKKLRFKDYTETCQVCGGKPVNAESGLCFRCFHNLDDDDDEDDAKEPICSQCAIPLVIAEAARGDAGMEEVWYCPNWENHQ